MSPSTSSPAPRFPAPPPPPTPTRSHSWPSAEPGPGPSTSLNLNLGLNLKSGTSKIIGSLKRSFSTKSQVAKEGTGLTRRHRPSASSSSVYHDHAPDPFLSSSPSSSSTAAPTVSQIAMGLHLSRTPHIPTRLEPYTSPHHPHRLHHHHPHPHPHARHQHHNPGLTKFSNASWASRPPARVRQRHSYQPGPAHAPDAGGVDGHDYVNKPASNSRHASDSTVRQTATSKNPKTQSTSPVSHAHPLPPPPSRSALKKRPSPISVSVSVPSLSPQPPRNDRYGDGEDREDRTLTSTPASSSLSGSLTTLESVMSGTTATSYTLPGPGTPTTPTSLDGTVKQAGLVGKLGLSRFLGVRGAGGVGAGRMSALEEMRARDGKRGNGSEGSLSVGGVSQSPSTMTSASTSTGTGTSMGGGGVRKAVRFDFVDVDGRADVES